jgi:hypothetical protein
LHLALERSLIRLGCIVSCLNWESSLWWYKWRICIDILSVTNDIRKLALPVILWLLPQLVDDIPSHNCTIYLQYFLFLLLFFLLTCSNSLILQSIPAFMGILNSFSQDDFTHVRGIKLL